ncbi:MAG TPA: carbamoyltransferase HypF [Thermoanaerobaculia bacterium]|nr:carbamoyltransferase HypF [Thermoanaerobaculia bacterium]
MTGTTIEAGTSRKRITIRGVVQGVGFRPFAFRLARTLGIRGFVLNSSSGVVMEAEATDRTIAALLERLPREVPPLARIDAITVDDLPPTGEAGFSIVQSTATSDFTLIAPDIAVCDDCLRETFDPRDRRYGYPFTNCTNCGPRYTIIRDLPYDRQTTAMRAFPMCVRCDAEFRHSSDRRFHAEANACPECGPGLALLRAGEGFDPRFTRDTRAILGHVRRLLRDGSVVAIRGIGGFHLACDATNGTAVAALRTRKRRSDKPFAVMVRDLATAERICVLSDAERALLATRERPIVIASRRPSGAIAEAVAPGNNTLGLMLPYTPLHALLFAHGIDALAMTSGNASEEPIAASNLDAWQRLARIADWFLLHDREIETRADDSVMRVIDAKPRTVRRSRGFAPQPIDLGVDVPELLACGADLKNSCCLTKERSAILSQHIGDLTSYESMFLFEETVGRMKKLFRVSPQFVAHDLHPQYRSTRFAQSCGLPAIGVQHHHAHIASCMAENGIREPVIGVAMDGTGFGLDGKVWGGEFLVGDLAHFERRAHLRYVPLAGGDAAIRQPWRSAVSYLRDASVALDLPTATKERELVEAMLDQRINVFETSSCGRLFDAVASMLGLRQEITFEAQAAIDLEQAVDPSEQGVYPFAVDGDEIDMRPTIAAIAHDLGIATIAAKFHNTLAEMIAVVCERIRAGDALHRVCLSGGVFQNALLLERTASRLLQRGFDVITHSCVPTNDGGIALGQAAIAAERIRRGNL